MSTPWDVLALASCSESTPQERPVACLGQKAGGSIISRLTGATAATGSGDASGIGVFIVTAASITMNATATAPAAAVMPIVNVFISVQCRDRCHLGQKAVT